MVTDTTRRAISPTDVSQFIRLDQCQRFLALRLKERRENRTFLTDFGVAAQAISPMLRLAGFSFEADIEKQVVTRYPILKITEDMRKERGQAVDNTVIVETASALKPGETTLVFQARIGAKVGAWTMRGDVDIIRFERTLDGELHILIVDMKSSAKARVEHRLQVAFYDEMLTSILAEHGVAHLPIELGILFRGPSDDGRSLPDPAREDYERQAREAEHLFAVPNAYLERIVDPEPYRWSVQDLVAGDDSVANRVLSRDFDDVPFHLNYKCDGCMYNEYCMKWAAEHDDLSLIPYLSTQDKTALKAAGITTVREVAQLKHLDDQRLVPSPETEPVVRDLAATWPIGPHLDELIHRARRYRKDKGDDISALAWIPSRGFSTIPRSTPDLAPNLVMIYIDAQHDYHANRLYLASALVVAHRDGISSSESSRHIVEFAATPPETNATEASLLVSWITRTLQAVADLAAPDANGEPNAPIHLVFFDTYTQRILLDALGRHASTIIGATAVYDLMTQLSGIEAPIATYLSQEVRARRNYPVVNQSLQALTVHRFFDWKPWRQTFRTGIFDFQRTSDPTSADPATTSWFIGRARFNSQIPLEYAYAAWNALPPPSLGETDDFASFRHVSRADLVGFAERRLDAIAFLANDAPTNNRSDVAVFRIPDLATFEQRARTLAGALDEFLTIERHVTLAEWKTLRHTPAEERQLSGNTLVVRYVEADQDPVVVERNRENLRRAERRAMYLAANSAADSSEPAALTREQRAETAIAHGDLTYRLRIDSDSLPCDLDSLLALQDFDAGDGAILAQRWDMLDDTMERRDMPVNRLLHGSRVMIVEIESGFDTDGSPIAFVPLRAQDGRNYNDPRGYAFGYPTTGPFLEDTLYTIDTDPTDWNSANMARAVEALQAGTPNRLYKLLTSSNPYPVPWSHEASEAQQRFLAGLDALTERGVVPPFETGKRRFIGELGDEPILLVQGPPGTGKSFSSSFALLARMQAAMATNSPCRIVISSRTHAAIDVLLTNVAERLGDLERWSVEHRDVFDAFFDRRLFEIDLFRMAPRTLHDGIHPIYRTSAPEGKRTKPVKDILGSMWCIVGATPSGVYGLQKDHKTKAPFSVRFADLVVMDEASQLSLPEAMAATYALHETGRVIVVGDHRQMAPIVKNDWTNERRRTFQDFQAYGSLFEFVLTCDPPIIRFEESFRLHRDMAAFLGREIYSRDGIDFHSRLTGVLDRLDGLEPFQQAVLDPDYPISLIVHDEDTSLKRNVFEQELLRPLVEVLHHRLVLDAVEGLGVVVPHTSQRAGLLAEVPLLTGYHPETGVEVTSVDTVERYQGDERDVIIISATESSREYLLVAGKFLMDPRRLNVALSRAKKKLILIAAASVFEIFSADEEMFANAQLWKNLLRKTCTQELWSGEIDGHAVTVWGNQPPD